MSRRRFLAMRGNSNDYKDSSKFLVFSWASLEDDLC